MLIEKSSEILYIDLKRIFCQFSLNKTTLDLKGKSLDPRTPRTWENAYGRVVMGVVPLRENQVRAVTKFITRKEPNGLSSFGGL